jgi:DNA-directed RNA polymerase specialized sigma24 family protein
MNDVWNNAGRRGARGAVYRSLHRVGDEALTLKEIAARYGLTESTAKARMRKAKRKGQPITEETFK